MYNSTKITNYSVGQTDYGRATIRWATDWILKAHTGDYEIWGQVCDGELDHAYWGRPEDMTMERPSYKIDPNCPGSDLAAETAAALASASIVFAVRRKIVCFFFRSSLKSFCFSNQILPTQVSC